MSDTGRSEPRGQGEPTLERLREVAGEIGRELGLRLILLVGSAAREDPGIAQDLDIAVLSRRRLDSVDLTNRLIRGLGIQEIDVADLGRADPLFLMLAVRDGRLLYEADKGEFARFASLAARRYADTRKFRDMERREIVDFIEGARGR